MGIGGLGLCCVRHLFGLPLTWRGRTRRDDERIVAALAEVEEWETRLAELHKAKGDMWSIEYDRAEAAMVEADRLKAALTVLVAAVEPLMDSKPTEILPDGKLKYDWTAALYAINDAMKPARAALVPADRNTT